MCMTLQDSQTKTELSMTDSPRADPAILAALVVALAATLGALFIGEVLGQMPCVLCWYQRIAMFPLALILGVAAFVDDGGVRRYALPLALAGGAVALWHSGLYAGVLSEAVAPCTREGPSCTDAAMTILGLPIPYLSLAAFVGITLCLLPTKGTRA